MRHSCDFGSLLKSMISKAGITNIEFYTALGITKPYFYDMLSGRINPPPRELQIRAIELLHPDRDTMREFYDLAARERNELPVDIFTAAFNNPQLIGEIRSILDVYSNNTSCCSGSKEDNVL